MILILRHLRVYHIKQERSKVNRKGKETKGERCRKKVRGGVALEACGRRGKLYAVAAGTAERREARWKGWRIWGSVWGGVWLHIVALHRETILCLLIPMSHLPIWIDRVAPEEETIPAIKQYPIEWSYHTSPRDRSLIANLPFYFSSLYELILSADRM